jgi:hypothetical protein
MASPALLTCLHGLARRTRTLLDQSSPFTAGVEDTRLALEISVIQALASRLVTMLEQRDPLSERVHLGKAGVAGLGLAAVLSEGLRRMMRPAAQAQKPRDA